MVFYYSFTSNWDVAFIQGSTSVVLLNMYFFYFLKYSFKGSAGWILSRVLWVNGTECGNHESACQEEDWFERNYWRRNSNEYLPPPQLGMGMCSSRGEESRSQVYGENFFLNPDVGKAIHIICLCLVIATRNENFSLVVCGEFDRWI